MNYQRIYNEIVDRAKLREIQEGIYYESHHILPKSMGGSNDEDNLVNLTAKEHYLCHWLLYKIHKTASMACAWRFMTYGHKKMSGRYTSRSFKYAREAYAKEMSIRMSGINNPMFGKKASEETRKKLSELRTGEKHHYYGKHRDDSTKAKISKTRSERYGKPVKATRIS